MNGRRIVVLVFLLSRLVAAALGVRFDADSVETHWQFLDARLLETDLAASLWNLHAQPPGMNALYGVLARISPADHGYVLAWLLFLGIGLAAALAVFEVATRLGDRRIAIVVACLFTASPATVLFENVFFYPHLVMAGLCGSALALERALHDGRMRWFAVFFGLLAAIALTRSSFHVAWLAVVGAAITTLAASGTRRNVALLAAASVVLVGAWYAKNVAIVGAFTGSTWFGMSLAKATANCLDDGQFARLSEEGAVTPLLAIPPFSPLERYGRFVTPPRDGHPSLVAATKANGATNYNNAAYVTLSAMYLTDAKAVIANEPMTVLRGQVDAWEIYFQPSSQYHHFIAAVFARGGHHQTNVEALGTVERVWNAVEGLQASGSPTQAELLRYARPEMRSRRLSTISWTSMIGTVVVVIGVPFLVWARLRDGRLDRRQAIVAGFALANIVFVAVIGNALEIGENQRFKFETEALWWMLVAFVATCVVQWRSGAGAPGVATPDSGASSSAADPGD